MLTRANGWHRAPCAEDELSMMDRLDRVIPKLREVVAAANGWEEEQQVTTHHRPSFVSVDCLAQIISHMEIMKLA